MRRRIRTLAVAAALLVTAGAVTASHPTAAAWTDSEYATATITSTGLAAPTKGTCTAALASFTVRWTPSAAAPTPTGYTVNATNPTTGAVVAGPVSLAAGSTSYTSSTLLGAVLVGTYNVNVFANYNNWTSSAITWPVTVVLLGLSVTC
jgi:hypothetical protein